MTADPARASGMPAPSGAASAPDSKGLRAPRPAPGSTPGLRRALAACRRGRWREGLALLSAIARATDPSEVLSGSFYSFLGVAVARCEGRKRDGVELCRYAVRLQPRSVENHLNLASVYLIARNRRAALRSIRRGLKLAPAHSELLELAAQVGVRRRPVVFFLPRSAALNRLLGRWRHRLILRLLARREDELD